MLNALSRVSFFLDPVDSEPAQIATGYVRDGRDYSVTWRYPDQPLRARLRIVAGNNVGQDELHLRRDNPPLTTPTADLGRRGTRRPGGDTGKYVARAQAPS